MPLHHQTRACSGLPAALGLLAMISGSVACGADGEKPAASAVIRDGFESPRTAWNQEQTDATINLQAHDQTTRAAHEGRTSEHFKFTAGLGSGFFFSYPLPKVPVTDALKASLFVRSTRAGVQLFARVVLPGDTDPDTKQASFLLVPGTIYDNVDRWQRLELLDLRSSLERQARVLRASTKRPVSLEGAYVEQLVVNLFTGAGETEVYLDELSVGPVPAALVADVAEPVQPKAEAESPLPPAATAPVRARLDRGRLKKRTDDGLYHDWVFTAIHAPGADVASLRSIGGFDVLIDDVGADPKRFQEAVAKGFLLMPRLGGDDVPDPDAMFAAAAGFPQRESVVAWDLGDRLGLSADPASRKEELLAIRKTVSKLRELPPGVSRLTTAIVDDNLRLFALPPQGLDILGVRAQAWGGAHSPSDTNTFLRQRRDLTAMANLGALYWAMLPATPSPLVPQAVWGRDVPPPGGFPQIQPEQIRLMTYAALSAGYRGLAFHGDAELTRGSGRMLLLEMGLLNAEIDLCESILANGADPIPIYNVFDPDPSTIPPPGSPITLRIKPQKELKPLGGFRAAAIGTRDRKGVLLLVADYAGMSQYQPAQSARNNMKITVIVPEGAQAFEISPGRFRLVEERERTVGGTRFTIPEFDTTALLLVTTDIAMAERVEAVVNTIRPRAAQMAIEQAELKLAWVTDVNGRLAADGHVLIDDKERLKRETNGGSISTDQADLLLKAAENIKAAHENAERLDWENAWSEARRASRSLRVLMRGLWQNALTAMVRANTPAADLANEELIKVGRAKRVGETLILPPTSSPPLVAFNTLPQHYLWVDWMKSGRFSRNLVPSGAFDQPETLEKAGWTNQSYQYDGIRSKVTTVEDAKNKRRRLLKMTVEAAKSVPIDTLPPFIEQPAAAIRSPAVKVRGGQFLRISVSVKRAMPTPEGFGGLIIRDSIGGEALQYVSTEAIPALTRVVIYRRAPADGDLTVTLGLAGYGEAFFDEFKIERVEAAPAFEPPPPDVARLARPRRPTVSPPTASRPPADARSGR
jgi:hypothetical protein